MVNLKEFQAQLIKENKSGLAELKSEGKTHVVNFYRFEDVLFIFPTCYTKIVEGKEKINEYINDMRNGGDYFEEDETDENISDYIESYIIPLIVDDVLYEVDSPQAPMYFLEEVESVRMLNSEKEALLLLLKQDKENN